jgi:hypothetical protein
MEPRIYVVQNSMRRDERGVLVPKFNFQGCLEFLPGVESVDEAWKTERLRVLLQPEVAPWQHDVMTRLRDGLRDFTEADFLLPVGNPIIIGLAAAVAADKAESVQFLQWNMGKQGYISIRVRVF